MPKRSRLAGRVVMLLALCTGAQAADLYRYQDENGHWQFSDRPPPNGPGVERLSVRTAAPEPRVLIEREASRGEVALTGVNEYHCPVELELTLTELENMTLDAERVTRVVLPPQSRTLLVTLKSAAPDRDARYSFEYAWMIGDPTATHAPVEPYRVPYAVAAAFPVTQGFHGRASHTDEANGFAVDIAMPVGTSVYAARGGIVVEVAYRNYAGGTDAEKDGPRANIVRILHEDGTFALYAHLDRASARVRPGDRVQTGEYIANSGNTGFSSGPHLHFAVLKNRGLGLMSVPFQFRGTNGAAVTPREGEMLTAFP